MARFGYLITGRRFWGDERLKRLGIAILLALSIALVLTYISDTENRSFLRSGDFPGFYAPAVILKEGKAQQLYDAALQREVENRFWPFFAGDYYMSVYPPYLAIILEPLAYLDPQQARDVFSSICIFFFSFAFILCARFNRILRQHSLFCFALLISCAPVFNAVLGGQNTALSMLLVMATAGCMHNAARQGSVFWQVFAGVLMGLWLFKPQFGLLAGAFLFFSGHIIPFLGFLISATLLYLLPVSLFGWNWPTDWMQAILQFSSMNYQANRFEQVSLMGFSKAISALYPDSSTFSQVPIWLAIFFSLLVVITVIYKMRKAKNYSTPYLRQRAVFDSFLVMGAAIPLISPQTLFYDLGIALICVAAHFRLDYDKNVNAILLGSLLVGFITFYRDIFILPPLFFLALGSFFFVLAHATIPKYSS